MATSLITLHVELDDIEPAFTRDLQVDGSLSLADLHAALQISFDWREQHLHLFRDFEVPDRVTRYWGDPYQWTEMGLDDLLPESETTVAEASPAALRRLASDRDRDLSHRPARRVPGRELAHAERPRRRRDTNATGRHLRRSPGRSGLEPGRRHDRAVVRQ